MLRAWWNGINTAWVKWVTTGQSAKREPATAERSVLLKRFGSVFAASGVETAVGPEHRRDGDLVSTYQTKEQLLQHGFASAIFLEA